MATITTDTFLDDGTARTAGEAWTLNGGKLTVRTDTRWHVGAPAAMTGTLGSQTVSAILGGGILLDGRNVRWMPYDSGSGNVPAIGTTVTQGGVSGYLLGVYDTLTSAPTAVGAAMPANGHIKFREVTGGPFAAGALTGIGASATGPDVVGWIEVVMDETRVVTASRLGEGHVVRGDWFYLDDTTGVLGQKLQVPTNGAGAHAGGVWVETAPGSDEYVFWGALKPTTNLSGWNHKNLGQPEGGTDIRQEFVLGDSDGGMTFGETVTQAGTYAPVNVATTYTWANDLLTVTYSAHALVAGDEVYLNFTTGGAVGLNGTYTVRYASSANALVIDLPGSGASGAATATAYATITSTAHDQQNGKLITLDVTSGSLPDGTYEVTGTVAANTFNVYAPVAPSSGNVTVRMTVGHIPPAGCKTRIPNVFMRACTTAARSLNSSPNATAATRPEFTMTGAGVIDWEYAYCEWYSAFIQAYAVSIKHSVCWDYLTVSEVPTPVVIDDVGLGAISGLNATPISVSYCPAGVTINKASTYRSSVGSNAVSIAVSVCNGLTITNSETGCVQWARAGYGIQITACTDVLIEDTTVLNHNGVRLITTSGAVINNLNYCERMNGVTGAAGGYAVYVGQKCDNTLIDGMTFGKNNTPIDRQWPYLALIYQEQADGTRLRNIGTRAAPATPTGHARNAPQYIFSGLTGYSGLKAQRLHLGRVRTGIGLAVNSENNLLVEDCSVYQLASGLGSPFLLAALNSTARAVRISGGQTNLAKVLASTAANASVYGTHIQDLFLDDDTGQVILPFNEPTAATSSLATTTGTPQFTSSPGLVLGDPADSFTVEMPYFAQGHTGFLGAADRAYVPFITGQGAVLACTYTWAGDVVTVTRSAHGLRTGDYVQHNFTSGSLDVTACTNDLIQQITVTGEDTYTFPYAGAGAGGAVNIFHHNLYEYQLDTGSGWGSWKTLCRPRYGVRAASGSPVVRMSSTAGINVGDYVTSSTIGDFPSGTTVLSVDSADQITMSANATATSKLRILYFTSLPTEPAVSPTTGFKMKVRVTPVTPNTLNVATYIHAFTSSTFAAQAAVSYPLDTVPLTLTGLKNPTEVRIFNAGTTTEVAGSESITSGTYTAEIEPAEAPAVDISILSLGYQNLRILNVDMTSGEVEIPVQQQLDRQYENA